MAVSFLDFLNTKHKNKLIMNEQKIQELLNALFQLKYNWKSDHSNYTSDVVSKEGRQNVENVIRSFLLDNRDEQLGVLEAKVFMYEQIISKSNFSPMIKTIKSKKNAGG